MHYAPWRGVGDVDGSVDDVDGSVGDVDGSVDDVDGSVDDVDGSVGDVDGSVDDVDGSVGDVDGTPSQQCCTNCANSQYPLTAPATKRRHALITSTRCYLLSSFLTTGRCENSGYNQKASRQINIAK